MHVALGILISLIISGKVGYHTVVMLGVTATYNVTYASFNQSCHFSLLCLCSTLNIVPLSHI